MGRKKNIICTMVLLVLIMAGCFEEDERVMPHVPGDEQSFTFDKSMYLNQSFFDLGTNSIVAENSNSAWVMRFAAQEVDWHIGINSANFWGVYDTGSDDPDSIPANPPLEEWIFDDSDGDPDSSAFAGWVNFTGDDTSYTNHIYLIGMYDGITYRPSWSAQFLHVDAQGYRFRIGNPEGGEWKEFEVPKTPDYNYQYFTPDGGGQLVQIEPLKDLWDLEFTQYGSIIYTNEGEPYPYYVRGVLLNRYVVSATLDTLKAFADITFEDVGGYAFSRRQDFIGYEWKDVEVDVNSNTAVYTVVPGITYIIRDTEGFYHKLRFISYYNDLGEKGFPLIEHLRL
jgi:hypothetical protein